MRGCRGVPAFTAGNLIRAILLSPYRAGLAGLPSYTPSSGSRFPHMLWSLVPFGSGQWATLEHVLLVLATCGRDSVASTKAHREGVLDLLDGVGVDGGRRIPLAARHR